MDSRQRNGSRKNIIQIYSPITSKTNAGLRPHIKRHLDLESCFQSDQRSKGLSGNRSIEGFERKCAAIIHKLGPKCRGQE